VEASSIKDPIEHNQADLSKPAKKPYHTPELTKHQQLIEITLGVQCSGTQPPCSTVQNPFL
jgi:hypothetical protein